MISRRQIVLALGAGAVSAPLSSFAQKADKVWRVGFLTARRRPDSIDTDFIGGLPRGLRELGYVEGKNLVIEWRFTDGIAERLPELAAELVRLKLDVIVSGSSQAISALQKATSTIPIVMATSGDPIGSGFVASLARPGGNITGLSNQFGDLSPKQLELLLAVVPKLSRVAVLVNPVNSSSVSLLKNAQSAARRTNVKLLPLEAQTEPEIENAFASMAREKAGAAIVMVDAFFIQQRRAIANLAVKHRLPSISGNREFAEAGGLMSYGPDLREQFRRAAIYVDKIFKGAKPGDLPVEQSATFEFLINERTAKALQLTVPKVVLFQADRVID